MSIFGEESDDDPLQVWLQPRLLSTLDVMLARALGAIVAREEETETDSAVLLAVALTSWAVRQGHVCLALSDAEEMIVGAIEEPLPAPLPPFERWRRALKDSSLVGVEDSSRPMVLDEGGRLYLQRYAHYQRSLAEGLLARCGVPCDPDVRDAEGLSAANDNQHPSPVATEVEDAEWLEGVLDRLFAGRPVDDEQRLAAARTLGQRLTIISGGPGTGKTTTVVRILALLQERSFRHRGQFLRIALLAPTGKAAAAFGGVRLLSTRWASMLGAGAAGD